MTTYRYLGWGKTNENGIAKLDHNSEGQKIEHSYTGTGAGEIDVLASLDNPVAEGSIVSETLPVFDCYKKDTGMSDYTDIWSVVNATLSRDGNYSTITESTTGTTGIVGISNVSLINYRIEVDVYQVDGTRDEWALQVVSSDYQDITSANAKLGEWKHISLDVTDAPINTRVRLATGGSCTELRFKNFMVYPNGDNDVISINASNPVIQSTETTNITGSLFLNGVLQKNTNIDVYKNGTKIDTINTGSSGVASYTYTGSGAGATEFQFKYGSILSETYSIYDAMFKDSATQTKWVNQSNYFQVNVDETGRTITKISNGNYTPSTVANSNNWDERLLINDEFICEFDVLNIPSDSTPLFRIYYNSSQSKQITLSTGHYKFKVTSDKISYWLDNGNEVVLSNNLNITSFENVAFVNGSLKFNNFYICTI